MRFAASVSFVVAALISTAAQAQYTGGVVKIGVLSDMSSLYSDLTGWAQLLRPTWQCRTSTQRLTA